MSEDGPDDIPMGMWPDVEVIAGAVECLSVLYRSCRIAIATNATVSRRPMIELALRRGGLLPYIDEIFCYTELGYRKDQPEFWCAVEDRMGVPLARMSMVGDSLEQDVYAPARHGMRAIWFNQEGRHGLPSGAGYVPMVMRLVDAVALVLA